MRKGSRSAERNATRTRKRTARAAKATRTRKRKANTALDTPKMRDATGKRSSPSTVAAADVSRKRKAATATEGSDRRAEDDATRTRTAEATRRRKWKACTALETRKMMTTRRKRDATRSSPTTAMAEVGRKRKAPTAVEGSGRRVEDDATRTRAAVATRRRKTSAAEATRRRKWKAGIAAKTGKMITAQRKRDVTGMIAARTLRVG